MFAYMIFAVRSNIWQAATGANSNYRQKLRTQNPQINGCLWTT